MERTLSPQLQALIERYPDVVQESAAARSSTGFEKSFFVETIWKRLRDGNRAHRKMIDPLELGAAVLPHIVLLDVIDGGEDFRWRLFGGAHSNEYGVNLTGHFLSDISKRNPGTEVIELIFRHCTETTEPTYYRINYLNDRECDRSCCGVILPLFDSDDTATVRHLLGCSEWIDL